MHVKLGEGDTGRTVPVRCAPVAWAGASHVNERGCSMTIVMLPRHYTIWERFGLGSSPRSAEESHLHLKLVASKSGVEQPEGNR